ncbi:MAG: ComF family protein [Deltaproteobacteria bacterium]|nr:ComF family protein [Deltaproteobacteria bacterium]
MLKAFLNLLLPQICPLCSEDTEDGQFCQKCLSDIRLITSPICLCCGVPFISQECEDHLCGRCIKKEMPFSIARSIGVYEGVLLDAIHKFKYNGKNSLAKSLVKIMASAPGMRYHKIDGGIVFGKTSGVVFNNSPDLIVPVPLHKTRLKERGFNQSLLLARGLARIYNLPMDYLNLKRIRATDHQVNLKGKDRLVNVKGAFAVEDRDAFKDKKVLLIDDVYTTGATISECSKVLKKAGAKDVNILTLARVVNL